MTARTSVAGFRQRRTAGLPRLAARAISLSQVLLVTDNSSLYSSPVSPETTGSVNSGLTFPFSWLYINGHPARCTPLRGAPAYAVWVKCFEPDHTRWEHSRAIQASLPRRACSRRSCLRSRFSSVGSKILPPNHEHSRGETSPSRIPWGQR